MDVWTYVRPLPNNNPGIPHFVHCPIQPTNQTPTSLKKQTPQGEADAYVHVTKIKSWDVCAADAVVHAAGGRFTDLRGKLLRYVKADPVFKHGLIAAAHPEDHEWYVEQLEGVDVEGGGGKKQKKE